MNRRKFIKTGALFTAAPMLWLPRKAHAIVGVPKYIPQFSCDAWQDFEFASVTTGNLDAHDHSSVTTSTIVDSGTHLSTSATGERATIKAPQGIVDIGTLGLACDFTSGTASFVQENITASNNASSSVWLKAPSFAVDASPEVFAITDASSNLLVRMRWRRVSGVYDFSVVASGSNASIGAALTPDVFYWLTFQFKKNTTCSFAVYDANMLQVGSTLTDNDTVNTQATKVRIGNLNSVVAAATFYYDDLCIDFTNANFPLGT